MHTFEPKDPIEVITPHGPGVVVYVTVYGPHANDIWCIATKADGQLRHYQTIQLQLAESGVIGMNEKKACPGCNGTGEQEVSHCLKGGAVGVSRRKCLQCDGAGKRIIAPAEKILQSPADPNRIDCFHKLPPNAKEEDYQGLLTSLGAIFLKKADFK